MTPALVPLSFDPFRFPRGEARQSTTSVILGAGLSVFLVPTSLGNRSSSAACGNARGSREYCFACGLPADALERCTPGNHISKGGPRNGLVDARYNTK